MGRADLLFTKRFANFAEIGSCYAENVCLIRGKSPVT